jgi:hypothetical protein
MTGGTHGNGLGMGMGHFGLTQKRLKRAPELVLFHLSPHGGRATLTSVGPPSSAAPIPAGVRHRAVTSSSPTGSRGASRRIASDRDSGGLPRIDLWS